MVRQEIISKIRELQSQPDKIRNISVIAHVDHGKSTLSDSLVCAAGLLSKEKAGDALVMDSMKEEKDRGITIKSSGISLPFDVALEAPNPHHNPNWPDPPAEDEKEEKAEESTGPAQVVYGSYLVNLIDSPGHVDFSPEVTAALRVTDGALVVVDCVEGVCVQTKTVLRQAIAERIKPVLFLNKMDRIFLELKMEPEEAYQTLARTVESVNVVIATYLDDVLGDVTVWPQNGSVAFGSGLHGWGFTLEDFAKLWHDQFNMSKRKMMKKLWGDWFFDPKKKKFVAEQYTESGKRLKRAFCQFVLEPLQMLFEAIMKPDAEQYGKIMKKLGIAMPVSKNKEEPLEGKKLMKAMMQGWLPAADAMLKMIVRKLPSPSEAQRYRVEKLYSGPMDDEAALAIRNCDPKGPLMVYISKMVPTSDYSRFYAFGRIFSGTVQTGQMVRIQGPDYVPGEEKSSDLHLKAIQGTFMMMGPTVENIGSCSCGNIVGLMGVDQFLNKNGTLTTLDTAHNFVSMKYSVSPIVRLAVEPTNPAHLNKLLQGLKKLAQADTMVQISTADTGEHIVAGCGELHLEVCLNQLKNDFMKDVPIRVSEPVVSYCESIDGASSTTVCSKSPNKLNRLFMTASPLGEDLNAAIDKGTISGDMESKARAKLLSSEYKWELSEARKIWCFGAPPYGQANIMVDCTKAVQYLHDVKESICGSFKQFSNSGVYCNEPLRGMRLNLTDAKIHPDPPHHGAGQIMPAARQGFYACQIGSSPCLLEPMYLCEITVPSVALQGAYQTLRQRRGEMEGTDDTGVGNVCVVKAYLPVRESFGFTQSLRQNTSGQAFPTLSFSHWQRMPGDMNDPESLARATVLEIRKRKGLSSELPQFNDFNCRL